MLPDELLDPDEPPEPERALDEEAPPAPAAADPDPLDELLVVEALVVPPPDTVSPT